MKKESNYKGPQSPPKEDLNEEVEQMVRLMIKEEREARRKFDLFVLILILILLFIIIF